MKKEPKQAFVNKFSLEDFKRLHRIVDNMIDTTRTYDEVTFKKLKANFFANIENVFNDVEDKFYNAE